MEKNTTDPSSVPDDSNDPATGATITSTEHEKTPERHSQEQPAESDSIIDVVGKKSSEQRAAKKGNLKETDTREDDEIAEKSNTETTSRKRKRKYIVFIIWLKFHFANICMQKRQWQASVEQKRRQLNQKTLLT